jgi:hypothetical protein
LSNQGSGTYDHPVVAYCVPAMRDPEETEIY